MSNIYSFGLDAYLTLGNKKAVDIVLRRPNGNTLSLESKGVNKKSDDWPFSNRAIDISCNVIYILLSNESNFHDLKVPLHLLTILGSIIPEKCKKICVREWIIFILHIA